MNSLIVKVKSNINKLLSSGFFHIFGSNVINKILGFISGVFIVRFVSKYEYGIYSSALNSFSFFLLVSGIGMLSGVLQLCSENAKNLEKNLQIFKYGSQKGIIANVILGFIIVLSSFILQLPIKESNDILLLLSFVPALEIANEFQKVYFRSRLDNKSYAYSNTIGTFFLVVFSIFGAYNFGIKGIIVARYLSAIVTIIITKKYFKGPIFIKNSKLDEKDRNILFKISFISMLNSGISELLYLVDIFVIGIIISNPDVIADYKVAIVIPTALAFIPASICIYIYPYFSMNKDNKYWVKKNLNLTLLIVGAINAIISISLFILAPYILTALFGEQYLSALTMFRLSALSYFFMGTFRIISGNILVTQRKLKFNFFVSTTSGILNVILNIVLIYLLGAVGAAWTTLFISCMSGVILTLYLFYIVENIEESKEDV